MILAYSHALGIRQAQAVLDVAATLGEETTYEDGFTMTEAMGRLLLAPEDRFTWRKAEGYTTGDPETKRSLDFDRTFYPEFPVATVLSNAEREALRVMREMGLPAVTMILASIRGLNLSIEDAMTRLATPFDAVAKGGVR